MAHFAEIDSNNIVINVVVIDNDILDTNGIESEDVGISFCKSLFGVDTLWVQTSYNARNGTVRDSVEPNVMIEGVALRKNFAGIGYTYDTNRDAFIPPQSYPSWVLDETTCQWESPTPYPTDGKEYYWDESTTSWIERV